MMIRTHGVVIYQDRQWIKRSEPPGRRGERTAKMAQLFKRDRPTNHKAMSAALKNSLLESS